MKIVTKKTCQCPLGLIPHFYFRSAFKSLKDLRVVSMPSRAYTSFLRLITVLDQLLSLCVNALSGLYLISTGYNDGQEFI